MDEEAAALRELVILLNDSDPVGAANHRVKAAQIRRVISEIDTRSVMLTIQDARAVVVTYCAAVAKYNLWANRTLHEKFNRKMADRIVEHVPEGMRSLMPITTATNDKEGIPMLAYVKQVNNIIPSAPSECESDIPHHMELVSNSMPSAPIECESDMPPPPYQE